MCGCEAHQTSLAKCNCMCEDHDKNFEPSVVILRKAIRELSDRLWVVEDELDSSHSTFTALAARATFAEGRDLPPDVWDRFGTRWSAVRVNNDLLWEGRGRRRTLEKVDEHYGPLTPTSPLAEDQEPLPDAGKDKDVEPCPKCGHYRDTPNHELGCEPK